MPSLFRLLAVIASWAPPSTAASMRCRISCSRSRARSGVDPARQILQEPLRTHRHGPQNDGLQNDGPRNGSWHGTRGTQFQRAAYRALSRHAGGGARRRQEYACGLRPRPRRFHRTSRRRRPLHRHRFDRGFARLSRRPDAARHDGRDRGAAALGDPAALSLPLRRRPAQGRSRRRARRPKARRARCPRRSRLARSIACCGWRRFSIRRRH